MDAEVVDASALAALLFGEPDADRVAEHVRAPLLTLDQELAGTAPRLGVSLVT